MVVDGYNFAFLLTLDTFPCSKTDFTSKKRSKTIALNEHISMTEKDISTTVGKMKCFKNYKNVLRFWIIVSRRMKIWA